MGLFKNKREEKECYINKRIENAIELEDVKLEKEIYLKKFDLIELKEGVKKSSIAILITILLTIATISVSWITIYNSLVSNSMKATEMTIKLKENLNDEEKKEAIDIFNKILETNIELNSIAINGGSGFLFIALGCFIAEKFYVSRQSRNIAMLEIEYNILTEELNRRKENINMKDKKLANKNIIREVAIDGIDKKS